MIEDFVQLCCWVALVATYPNTVMVKVDTASFCIRALEFLGCIIKGIFVCYSFVPWQRWASRRRHLRSLQSFSSVPRYQGHFINPCISQVFYDHQVNKI